MHRVVAHGLLGMYSNREMPRSPPTGSSEPLWCRQSLRDGGHPLGVEDRTPLAQSGRRISQPTYFLAPPQALGGTQRAEVGAKTRDRARKRSSELSGAVYGQGLPLNGRRPTPMCLLAEVRTALALMSTLSLMAGCATTQSDHRNESRSAQTESVELNVELLAPNLFDELVIEVDVAGSCSPREESLAELKSLAGTLLSPATVTLVGPARVPDDQWPRAWTREEFQKLAAANIRSAEGPRQASVYVLYVDRQDERTAPGGKAVDWIIPTSAGTRVVRGMFMVCDSLEHSLVTFTSRAALETFVLKHEFGHVLGLVNNSSHESKSAPSHCSQRGCLMETFLDYGVARYLALGLPGNRLPRAFCPQCLADLAATRERASLRSAEDNRRLARMQGELSAFDKAIEAGDLPRVIDLGRTLGSTYPDRAGALLAGGVALSLAGESDAAISSLARALELGADQRARLTTARLLCALGMYESAIALVPPELARNDPAAARTLAWALEGSDRYQEAIDLLGAYMESGVSRGERFDLLEKRAHLMRIAGRPREALEELNSHPYAHEYWGSDALIELSKVLSALRDSAGARKALLEAKEDRERQLRVVSGTPEERRAAPVYRLDQLKVDALLGHDLSIEKLTEVIALIADAPADARPELGIRLAGVFGMFSQFDAAVDWCARSERVVTTLFDSKLDPALSDDFQGLREAGRVSPRFPWCQLDPAGTE